MRTQGRLDATLAALEVDVPQAPDSATLDNLHVVNGSTCLIRALYNWPKPDRYEVSLDDSATDAFVLKVNAAVVHDCCLTAQGDSVRLDEY